MRSCEPQAMMVIIILKEMIIMIIIKIIRGSKQENGKGK